MAEEENNNQAQSEVEAGETYVLKSLKNLFGENASSLEKVKEHIFNRMNEFKQLQTII